MEGNFYILIVHGEKYFLTLVDEFSRFTWIFLLTSKSDYFNIFENFSMYVLNHFQVSIKAIRIDNGGEFFFKPMDKFLQSKDITHYSSFSHTSQQNEVVERKHKHLLDVIRSLQF